MTKRVTGPPPGSAIVAPHPPATASGSAPAPVAAAVSRPVLMSRVPTAADGMATAEDAGPGHRLKRLPILGAVLRRSLPRLLEASLIPNVVFYLSLVLLNAGVAMVAVACWSYGAVVRRVIRRQAIPGILLLAVVGLTLRTALSLWSGSEALYFVQPILTTVVIGGLFLVSILFGRPLVGRLAADFCPFAPEVATRPAVLRLFTGLTVLWAGVYLATALTTFVLLVTLPLAAFVATKTLACLAITGLGVFVTVSCCLRTAHREGLVFGHAATAPPIPVPIS
jgi:hypothetical protein